MRGATVPDVTVTLQESFERAQRAAMPAVDLTDYEGAWVAVRDGRVVASSLDAVALRRNPAVDPDDMLIPVPLDGRSILIA